MARDSDTFEVAPAEIEQGIRLTTGHIYHIRLRRPAIYNCEWSLPRALVGEEVELRATIPGGPPSGAPRFTIFEHDADGSHDEVETIEGTCAGDLATARWKVVYVADDDDVNSAGELAEKGYTLPEFFFRVEADGNEGESPKETAALLQVIDVIDRPIVDEFTGEPIPGARYELILADGTRRQGTLTEDSRLVEENVPPGIFDIEIEPEDPELEVPDDEYPFQIEGVPADPDFAARTAGQAALDFYGFDWYPDEGQVGEEVAMSAGVAGAEEGEEVQFRIFKVGQQDPVAQLTAQVTRQVARATWTVAGATGTPDPVGGGEYADFTFEVECDGHIESTTDEELTPFRGFTPAQTGGGR